MLITLESNNDADAANFSNYFKQSVEIQPGSTIALLSVAYNIVGTGARGGPVLCVNIDNFKIDSICKAGGLQNCIGVVPFGLETDPTPGVQVAAVYYKEVFNVIYHQLKNKEVENHNQLNVRITDAAGVPITRLSHPTIITLDIQPKPN